MATDPSKGMRDYRLAAEAAAKDVDKIAERIRASLAKVSDKLGKEFNSEMRFLVAAFKKGTSEMDVSLGTLPKSMERAFSQMGAITERGGKRFLSLRKAIEGVGTFLPKALGINAFGILHQTVENAAKMDAEFVVKHAAIGSRSEQIVKAFTGEGNAARRTFDIIQAGRQYALAGAVETYKQEVAQARGNSSLIVAAREKLSSRIIDLDKRTQRERSRASLTEGEKFGADAGARRVSGGARGIMASAGDLSLPGLLQRTKTVQNLAAAEKDVSDRRRAGDAGASLTTQQRGMSELLGVVQKLAAGITPMTVMAQVVIQLINAFDRAKMSGAAAMEAVSVQGPLRAASGFGMVKDAALALKVGTQGLIDEMGNFRTINVDELQISSAKAARTMGGLGKEAIPGVITGLSAVQIMAPLAGLEASSALGMVTKGQKAFGLKNQQDVRNYFHSVLGGARAAGMGVDDFLASTGDIDKLGMTWGLAIDKMVGKSGSLTKMMAGVGASAPSGVRGMVSGAFTQLSNLSIGKTLAMQMAGNKMTFRQAVGEMATGGDPLGSNVKAFRGMMGRFGLQTPGKDMDKLGKVAILLENQFGTQFAKTMMRNREVLDQFLTGNVKDKKAVEDAMKQAERDADPMRAAANIAAAQNDTLTQIHTTIQEFMQGVLGSFLFSHGDNPARDAARGRSNALVQHLTKAE